PSRGRRVTLRSGTLQKLRHSLQDFARKLLVRYRASHADGTDKRAISQDCLCSCGALVLLALVILVGVTNQSCDQRNVVSNLPSNDSASALVAARDISCQSAARTARACTVA